MGNRAEVLRGIDWVKVGGKFREIGCGINDLEAPTEHLAVGQRVGGDVRSVNFIAADEIGSDAVIEHGDAGELCIIHDAGDHTYHRNRVGSLHNSYGNGKWWASEGSCGARNIGVFRQRTVENWTACAGSIGSVRCRNRKVSWAAETEIVDTKNLGKEQEI